MIINKTKNRTLASRNRICDSILSKAKGLMFSMPIRDFGLVFRFRDDDIRPLHMFFVFYPIDVLFLDKDYKIVEIKKKFRPFTFYQPKKKSRHIIELPAGTADKCSISDVITFK